MTISPEMVLAVGSLFGSLFTAILTGLYWMVKLRKDVDAAHAKIRQFDEWIK